jgi:hypothetical protein
VQLTSIYYTAYLVCENTKYQFVKEEDGFCLKQWKKESNGISETFQDAPPITGPENYLKGKVTRNTSERTQHSLPYGTLCLRTIGRLQNNTSSHQICYMG